MRLKEQITAASALILSVAALFLFTSPGCASKDKISKSGKSGWSGKKLKGGGYTYLKKSKPYTIMGVTYYPLEDAFGYDKEGLASWYGKKFHGRSTANGETYDMHGISAAHKTLPLGTMVEVTRLDNGQTVAVRINDRGPFVANRIIDLSYGAAKSIGIVEKGTSMVRVIALAKGKPNPTGGAPVVVGDVPDLGHGKFFIQVGAFLVIENAEKVKERLLEPRERIRFAPVTLADGRVLTRVRVGPVYDMTKANGILAQAIEQGFSESFIIAE